MFFFLVVCESLARIPPKFSFWWISDAWRHWKSAFEGLVFRVFALLFLRAVRLSLPVAPKKCWSFFFGVCFRRACFFFFFFAISVHWESIESIGWGVDVAFYIYIDALLRLQGCFFLFLVFSFPCFFTFSIDLFTFSIVHKIVFFLLVNNFFPFVSLFLFVPWPFFFLFLF